MVFILGFLGLRVSAAICRSRSTRLYASRHLASLGRPAGDPPVDNSIPIDPKKQAILDKLMDIEDAGKKTGAQLRKDRKGELRKKRLQQEAITKRKLVAAGVTKTAPSGGSGSGRGKIRFVLGNKVEGLTAAQLLELVRSTAPYLFPETAPKMVMDDEDDEDDEEAKEEDEEGKKDSISEQHGLVDTSPSDSGFASLVLEVAADPEKGPLSLLRVLPPRLPASEQPDEQQRVEYFALCLAAHFSTVATYVPTDVDSKIRGHCWKDPSEKVLKAQFEVLKLALCWDAEKVSTRTIRVRAPSLVLAEESAQQATHDPSVVSGHDGEWLGVLCGAWGAFLRMGNAALAAEAEALISAELQREAGIFASLRLSAPSTQNDLLLLKAASILTHNVGDVDQGLGYWYDEEDPRTPVPAALVSNKQRFSKLAHERAERFGGEFVLAKLVYKELLAAEGHRHYPLREARCLRRSPVLMLPLGPWLESWGRTVATYPGLGHEDRLSVLRQLLRGCDSNSRAWCVPNQVGYLRALQGFIGGGGGVERWMRDLGQSEQAVLREHTTRLHLGLSERAFADKLGSRARELLEDAATQAR